MPGIVTLLTDFGTADYFVGAMKGVMLGYDPRLRLVDITHDIRSHDIAGAAFQLLAVHRSYPPGTVHLAVVDPGVGSSRRAIISTTAGQLFVGPDNGLFSRVWEREGTGEVRSIATPPEGSPSRTFHGRDIFAPVAARLATGTPPNRFGPTVSDPVRLPSAAPRQLADGSIEATILHVDRFGNCVTSLTAGDLDDDPSAWELDVGSTRISEIRRFYAEEDRDTPFLIVGSAEYIEISVNGQSAAARLGVRTGDSIVAHRRGAAVR